MSATEKNKTAAGPSVTYVSTRHTTRKSVKGDRFSYVRLDGIPPGTTVYVECLRGDMAPEARETADPKTGRWVQVTAGRVYKRVHSFAPHPAPVFRATLISQRVEGRLSPVFTLTQNGQILPEVGWHAPNEMRKWLVDNGYYIVPEGGQ